MCGEVHAAYGLTSTRHSNRTPGSDAVNSNVGRATRVIPLGSTVSVVWGGPVSTLKLTVAAADTFPAASVAVTEYVCSPSAT